MAPPIRLFISYAPADQKCCEALVAQLAPLVRRGLVTISFVLPGADPAEVAQQISQAALILLLVSADYLADAAIHAREITPALARQKSGAQVIPVLVRDALWEESDLRGLAPLPSDRRPITSWPNQDEAWCDVVAGVRRIVRGLRPKPAWHRAVLPALAAALLVGGVVIFWPDSITMDPAPVESRAFAEWLNDPLANLEAIDIFQEVRAHGQLYAKLDPQNPDRIAWNAVNKRFVAPQQKTIMVAITWHGAAAYCRSKGQRLPSAAEWRSRVQRSAMSAVASVPLSEWTADADGSAPSGKRMVVGGTDPAAQRSYNEDQFADDLGFRCVRERRFLTSAQN
jgi:hypothetical protein